MKKKLLTLLLAGCMVLSMAACGSKETKEPSTENNTTEDDAQESETEVDTSALGASTLTELGEYKGLTYTAMDTAVTDEEVEQEVQVLLEDSYTKQEAEVAKEDSIVNIDYEGKKDGVAFDGGAAQGYEMDLANSGFIDGFAESIVGMKVGETKDCPMTFPEDYHSEDLAGADVVFTITVNECWDPVPAELNDAFAEEQGYGSVDELYAGIREELEANKKESAENQKKAGLIQLVIDSSTFALDDQEVALYADDLKAQYETYASYFGVDLETYVTAMTGMTLEEFEEECKNEAIYRIQCILLQTTIAEKEGLEVTDEIYQEKAEGYVEYYGYESVEALEEAVTKEAVESQVIADMALDIIIENAIEE